ncbi:cytochrome c oxidase subunit II [Haladaptatus paucihalophilus]|uniref:cytochrome-c oxidase n=1 Tax=Haladaptatus paucihalophilus DX253 TaxID=797209 RepID=A0A1M6Q1E6_HALPU|nr:cytochrome c oxidase subunit II [Haladaptatus paucihalophilus]SHK14075.1 cytochrome c oxidase subunit 2 [Haladaptatus paucihalophilus DX253]
MRLRRRGASRWGALVCLFVVGIAAVQPAAAQSVNKRLIDSLNYQLAYVALPLTLFVEIILVYAVFKFRNNDDPLPTAEDPPLEITWTIATAIILLFVGVAAFTVLTNPYITPTQPTGGAGTGGARMGLADAANSTDSVTVRGLAYQWGWQFSYPGTNVTTRDELVLPANTDIYVRMTSADVIHSLFVPQLGVKQDVFPKRTTVIHTRVFEPGTYRGYCAEFCGSGHARMRTEVRVLPKDEYRQWLRNSTAENGSAR